MSYSPLPTHLLPVRVLPLQPSNTARGGGGGFFESFFVVAGAAENIIMPRTRGMEVGESAEEEEGNLINYPPILRLHHENG